MTSKANKTTAETIVETAQKEAETPQQEAIDKANADGVPLEELLEPDIQFANVGQDELIEKLQNEAAMWQDKALRAAAEEENTRARFAKEKVEILKFASAPLATEMFAVADILHKALEHLPQELREKAETKNFIEGLEFTEQALDGALQKVQIQKIGNVGDKFDPSIHQAVSIAVDSDAAPNTIVQVLQSGYILHGRILRAAMVIVSKA